MRSHCPASFLVIDKPPGLTSHDIVAIVRAVTGLEKVGHTGTLDPFATGVLPLALGPATRLIRFLDEKLKVYDATIAIGSSTTTGDPEGEVVRTGPPIDPAKVPEVLASFLGHRMQKPPAYSAVKKDGKPLYKYARAGVEVEVDARPIEIFAMKAISVEPHEVRVEIHCTRGTYARVLADEVAEALGSAGHLRELRRLQSGPFNLGNALTMSEISQIAAGRPDWLEVFRRGDKNGERVRWRPRAEVLPEILARCASAESVLAHLPRVSPGERVDGPSMLLQGGRPVAVVSPDGGRIPLAESGPTG